jgi:DNA-binding MarR family transcriptional regulator
MSAPSLPLSALWSQAFVAFTIECDNEFEHQMPHRTARFGSTPGAAGAPWLISMAMWAHCLRHGPEGGIPAAEFARRARLSRRSAEMTLKRMSRRSWGYLDVAADRVGAPRSAWLVRLTPAGRRAQQVWEPLADEVTARWRSRFGASNVDRLHSGLSTLVDELDVALPEFMPITELSGNWGVRSAAARARGGGSRSDSPLYALLSGLLVAFGVQLERATGMSPVLSANVVRVLDDAVSRWASGSRHVSRGRRESRAGVGETLR